MWYCYILRCLDENHKNLTYNGSTNDLKRRLRQHNGLLCGGAKATKGKKWEVYALVSGFQNHNDCLSCEWKIRKPLNKKRTAIHCGVAGRIKGLSTVLMLDKWTSKCKVENKDCNFKVYIVEDMSEHLDTKALPDNIEVITVKKMDQAFLLNLENENKTKEQTELKDKLESENKIKKE
jgi:predicted GIY-YIG superfamily endonuclease